MTDAENKKIIRILNEKGLPWRQFQDWVGVPIQKVSWENLIRATLAAWRSV